MEVILRCEVDVYKINFNEGWHFKRLCENLFNASDYETNMERAYGENWEIVNLPHTARLEARVTAKSEEGNPAQQWQGVCCYYKRFCLPREYEGKKLFIHFEAAMNVADIWVNGKHLKKHLGGFLPFTLDITETVTFNDENLIEVRLDNFDNEITGPKPMALLDFNMYHGLYRNVYLLVKDLLHITDPIHANKIAGGGVFVTYPVIDKDKAEAEIKIHITNGYNESKKFQLRVSFLEQEGNIVVSKLSDEIIIMNGQDIEEVELITIVNPKLWNINNPYLYKLCVELLCEGKLVDSETISTGIRKIKITKDGFWLNGEKLVLRGANRHQEYPYIGYALPDAAQYRDAKRIKEAGFDYVRLSHYPQSPAFMEACKELGLFVMNCIPGWQYFGGEEFKELQYQNCRDMIRRDRNHPSVLLWEASINETDMPDEFVKEMNRIVHEEYPGEQCYSCGWQQGYDVFGQARQHGGCHTVKDMPCVITEYGDWEYYAQNEGFNQENWKDLQPCERNTRQLRGHGEIRLLQQAKNYQEAHNDNKSTTAFADSIWVMYDYNRGYAEDIEASGIMDINRIPKFSYYFFKSQRDPEVYIDKVSSGPMVYIANYWTKNSPLNVRVFSNCEEVSLYLNGNFLEKRIPDKDIFSNNLAHPPFTFNIKEFEEGELKAVGFIKCKECTQYIRCTPTEGVKLNIHLEELRSAYDEDDILFVYASVEDKNGTIVPDAEPSIQFSVQGPAKLIGENPVKAEAGIATVLIQKYSSEKVEIKAEAVGLEPAVKEM